MKKLLKYKKFTFAQLVKEDSQFLQYQFGIEPFSAPAGYSFAVDPKLSMNGDQQGSPYTDFYARQSGLVSNVINVMKGHRSELGDSMFKSDNPFVEDLELFKNLKILRIFENQKLKLDTYISFDYNEEEYFGVYKDFNYIMEPKLESELFWDMRNIGRMNQEYRLKLSKYFYKKLENWFIPEKGWYKCLAETLKVRNDMGAFYEINKDKQVEVLGYNLSKNNQPYIILNINNEKYYISNNDYFYFKWRFEKA
jgi:hypothetical protein